MPEVKVLQQGETPRGRNKGLVSGGFSSIHTSNRPSRDPEQRPTRTCPLKIRVNRVFLSFSFISRSMKVSLLVLTWNLSLVNKAPEILL